MKKAIGTRFAHADRSFLVLGSLSAFIFLFLTPPFHVPDEAGHFFRSYQISEGRMVGIRLGDDAGAMLPESLVATARAWSKGIAFHPEIKLDLKRAKSTFAMPLAPERRRFKSTRMGMAYAPVPYLPQAVGIGLGRALGAPPIGLLYLARLVNSLTALLLCLWAIRLVPFGKWPVFVMMSSPIFCFLRSSASPDAVTYSLAFVNLSVSLAIASASTPPERKLQWAYVATAILLFLSKHAYFSVPLAILVALDNGAVKAYVGRLLLSAYVPGLLLIVGWLMVVSEVMVPVLPGSNPRSQLQFVLADPIRYVSLLFGHLSTVWTAYGSGLVGVLGWLDTPLPTGLVSLHWVVLLAVTSLAKEARRPSLPQRLVLLVCAVLGYLGVVSLLYLLLPVGADRLRGVQARYLIPLLALLMFAIIGIRPSSLVQRYAPAMCWSLAVVSMLVTFGTLVDRYYVSLW